MEKQMKSPRNAGIDLLRTAALLMLLLVHLAEQGGVLSNTAGSVPHNRMIWLMLIPCSCALDCFALISGFVGCTGSSRYARTAELWLQVLWYSLGLTLAMALVFPGSIGKRAWLAAAFPVLSGQYPYFSAFLLLSLLKKPLNRALATIDQPQLHKMLVFLFLAVSVLPALYGRTFNGLTGRVSALWLLILYLLGACLRRSGLWRKGKPWVFLMGYGVCILLTMALKVLHGRWTGAGIAGAILIDAQVFNHTSPTVIGAAVCLVLAAASWPAGRISRKLAAVLTPAVFGTCLLWFHPLVSEMLLNGLLSGYTHLSPLRMAAALAAATAACWGIGLAADWLREGLFRVTGVRLRMDRLEQKLLRKV